MDSKTIMKCKSGKFYKQTSEEKKHADSQCHSLTHRSEMRIQSDPRLHFRFWIKESNTARFIAVELPEHLKSRNKTNEAKAHHQHHRQRNFQPRGVVHVEPQHVASGTGATSNSGGAGVPSASSQTTSSHAGGCGSGATRSHEAGAVGGAGCCGGLRLRCASRHCYREQRRSTARKCRRDKKKKSS